MNDIALIQVQRIEFTRSVMPACLQTDVRDMHSDQKLFATGWGTVSAERKF